MKTSPEPLLPGPALPGPLIPPRPRRRPRPLGQILVEMGELDPGAMLKAAALQAHEEARFGNILLANGLISEDGLYRGLARQFGCRVIDLAQEPPDPRLIRELTPETCLRLGLAPWRRVGAAVVVVTADPAGFAEHRPLLAERFGRVLMAVAPERAVQEAVLRASRLGLIRRAERLVPPEESCRGWPARRAARAATAALATLAVAAATAPAAAVQLLSVLAIVTLLVNTGFKSAATIAALAARRRARPVFATTRKGPGITRNPTVSLLVPLFREREIASRLVRRLERLDYPRELLDICLIVEEEDRTTQDALQGARLPAHMRRVVVPRGTLKTKPRAMNYALNLCRGSIIGIYDAEDEPEPDQIRKMVQRFRQAGPEVACLQGVLDFYNTATNWISRCFTIEYATWFRLVLPGLQALGLVIPLGGTTVFFRREALEDVGGWDAHNVTEDADLGVRLARHGYRTELIATVTREEANHRPWPWVKQRSRWLKGYAITWAVHMRRPRALLRSLGARRFAGLNLLFLGSLTHFLMMPVLLSFWLPMMGFPHPFWSALPEGGADLLALLLFLAMAVEMAINFTAISRRGGGGGLWPWALTLPFYFLMGSAALAKALWELFTAPYYWDKTAHGIVPEARAEAESTAPAAA